jgi:hypothetical protein
MLPEDNMSVPQYGILRAVTTFNLGDQSKAQNVWHLIVMNENEQDEADVVADVAEILEDVYDYIKTIVATTVEIEKHEIYHLQYPDFDPIGVATSSWAGTAAVTRVPAGVACLVHFYKLRTGYSDKKFIAGLTENAIEGDTWSSGVHTNMGNLITAVLAGGTGTNGVELEFRHYNRDTGATAEYTSGAVGTTVAYQRRRKPGVGLT